MESEELRRELGRVLRFYREKVRGWTRDDLKAASGLGLTTIVEVEDGSGNPTVNTIQAIASALNVPIQRPFLLAVSRLSNSDLERIIDENGKSGSTGENLTSDKGMNYPVTPSSDTFATQPPRPINTVAEGVSNGTFGARSGLEIVGITETEARILEHIGTLLVRASHLVLAPSPDGQVAGEEPRRRKTDR